MNEALVAAGLVVNDTIPEQQHVITTDTNPRSIARCPFKDVFEEYCSLREGNVKYDLTFRANQIEVEKPLVKEAYEILGPEKVRQMNYNQSNLKREIIKVGHETLEAKVFMLIKDQFPQGVSIPCTEIKNVLKEAYRLLGSKKTPKATDLQQ